ncbi:MULTISPECIES: N-acetyltransferase family protein [Bacillaceae]|uniref:GNAT family N-acetyltransferase n=1 Tax=Bacillaceae TaxID=186817 RepID=UPI002A18547C|nr:N-acetyltransferase family protein [Cytobacillus sp. IB215316]MDX8361303.1 GNAT family N-acetyltransferase [Cytobacillus sp. IB215316]
MVIIRDAHQDDLLSILNIYNQAIVNTTATFDLTEETLEQRQQWFSKYGSDYPLIVATIENKVVGYCCLSAFREKAAYAKTVELSVYVDENTRGHGVATKLVNEILLRAKQIGFHVIISGITKGNDSSIKLHEKFGFEFIGSFKEVGYKFDSWQDVLFYQLIMD